MSAKEKPATPFGLFYHNGQAFRVVASARERENADDQVFDKNIHKGKIVTPDSKLKIQFVKASISTYGDEGGPRRAHLRTTVKRKRGNPRYDNKRGVRFYINTGAYSTIFKEEAEPNSVDADLKRMRPISVGSAEKFISYMPLLGPNRWKQSKVLHRHNKLDMDEFFARYPRGNEKHPGFGNVVNRLLASDEPQLCLMEIQPLSTVLPVEYKSMTVKSKELNWGFEPDGRERVISPSVNVPYWIDGVDERWRVKTDARMGFMHEGRYFVLGYATLNKFEGDNKVIYYIKLEVINGQQIALANLEDLAKLSAQKEKRRSARKAALPENQP